MKRIIHFLPLLMLLMYGCDQELTVENDLPYIEKMVVRGLIRSESAITVRLSRTEPLNAPLNYVAGISDASIHVAKNRDTFQLFHTSDGVYTNCDVLVLSGNKYKLLIDWQDKKVTAETSVPPTPKLIDASWHIPVMKGADTVYYLSAIVKPAAGFIYGVVFGAESSDQTKTVEDSLITMLKRESDKGQDGLLEIRTRAIPRDVFYRYLGALTVKIYCFDEQIYKYYLTQNANLALNNIFTSVGTNLRWNVTGDAIGLFIGHVATAPFVVTHADKLN